jgi:hypothetical protein
MQWPRDDYVDRANRRADLHTQGVKGLFILNGGGILSLLTFLTQIIVLDKPRVLPLIWHVKWAIASMTLGLILVAVVNHIRYETSRLFDKDETRSRGRKLGLFHRILFYASLVCFLGGCAIALSGMSNLIG